ncbi:MAG TPA: hypothetical protein VGM56_10130, partial [Byssovorax sp.]
MRSAARVAPRFSSSRWPRYDARVAKLGVAFAGAAAVSLLAVLATAEPSATAAPAASTCDLDVVKRVVEEGRARGDVDDWTGALAKFRDAATCAESPGLRFNIASSEEHLGKLVAAVTDFRLAQREAKRDGAAEVVDVVAARLAALEPRIATLTFRRPAGSERAVVFVDGLPLADVASGRVEVDPGEHRVTALLDGVMRFHRTVRVVDGRTERVVLALEPLPPPPVAPRPPVAGYVVGGAGLVSLAVMGLFIGLRQGIIADLDVA